MDKSNAPERYIHRTETELLRFITCGSVDDGKSTLIGRLLYDSRNIPDDLYDAIVAASRKYDRKSIDLSMLTDGLRLEREKGITIDVAYRYFTSGNRKFIISDTPGHFEYTRNMVTGASNANLAVILVDARFGIADQTRRHAFIASLLRIPHVVLCVNKMDLVGYDESVFRNIVRDFRDYASRLEIRDVQFIPLSALHGDNVVLRSENMPWYQGTTLMYHLENVHISSDLNHIDGRLPVQIILESDSGTRSVAGGVAGGVFRSGDIVTVLPGGEKSRIRSLRIAGREVSEVFAPLSVSVELEDDIPVERGDMIVRENNLPFISERMELMICWLDPMPLVKSSRYILRHTTREVPCMVVDIQYRMELTELRRVEGCDRLGFNETGKVAVRTDQPVFYDPYRRNRVTGSVILIDPETGETVAAGMII